MNTIQKPLRDEIRKLAEKHNIDPSKIEEIEKIMWDFVRHEMVKGEHDNIGTFENIYLRYLGTFFARKGMIEHMKKNKNE